MKSGLSRTLALGAAALITLSPMAVATADLNPAVAPGGNFALDHWSITTAEDSSGGNSGKPVTAQPRRLAGPAGYQSKLFHTETDGSMAFVTPINGAAAGGSTHPRTELREQLVPGKTTPNWDQYGTSILDATLKIVSVPAKDNSVIIGQVHGYNVAPLVLLYYVYKPATGLGTLYVKYQDTPEQGPKRKVFALTQTLKLNETFRYQIRVANGVASTSFNDGAPASVTLDASWANETFYFKAGSYLRSADKAASDGAEVRFYQLAASHPNQNLDIATPASLPSAVANATYSVALSATGGAGGKVWSLASGQPPEGLSLGADGVLSGAASTRAVSAQPHDFTALVRDANGNTAAKTFSILVQ